MLNKLVTFPFNKRFLRGNSSGNSCGNRGRHALDQLSYEESHHEQAALGYVITIHTTNALRLRKFVLKWIRS